MMNSVKILVAFFGCSVGLWMGFAQAVEVLTPLQGYKCMSLKADLKYNDFVPGSVPKPPGGPDMPPVYRAPTVGSARIGYAIPTVIVAWPLDEVNGFIRVLWGQKGIKGWIAKDLVVDYQSIANPSATCTPVRMANENIGPDIK